MKQLQDYLNGDGKELENDIELQSFYTLPFIEDIHADTFFSKILEQRWLDELSRNLDLFITNHKQVSKFDVIIRILCITYLYPIIQRNDRERRRKIRNYSYNYYEIYRIWST